MCGFAAVQIVKTIEHRMGRYTQVVLDTCAYAGTGNVLKVQELLHLCAEHLDDQAEHQVTTRRRFFFFLTFIIFLSDRLLPGGVFERACFAAANSWFATP